MSPSLIQALLSTQALRSFLLPSRPLQASSASHRFSEFNRDSVPSDHEKTFTARMWDKKNEPRSSGAFYSDWWDYKLKTVGNKRTLCFDHGLNGPSHSQGSSVYLPFLTPALSNIVTLSAV